MNDGELRKYCEDAYKLEHQIKDQLNSRISFPVTYLVLMVGFLGYLVNDFNWRATSQLSVMFIVVASLDLSLVVISISYIFVFLLNHSYDHMPTLLESVKYREQLREFHRQNGDDNHQTADAEFEKYMIHTLAECQNHNAFINSQKSRLLIRTMRGLLGLLVFLALTTIPFYCAKGYK